GHATGNFTDNDSDIEVIDDGGQAGGPGRSRDGQVRYTWVSPWPGFTVVLAAEQPASEFTGPNGTFASDSSPVAVSACPTANLSAGPASPVNQLATACLANSAEFDAAQSSEPASVMAFAFANPGALRNSPAGLKPPLPMNGRAITKP